MGTALWFFCVQFTSVDIHRRTAYCSIVRTVSCFFPCFFPRENKMETSQTPLLSDQLSALVTVFLSSSPRPQDARDDNAGAIMLHQALLSVRQALGLSRCRTVCIFDGRHPALSDEQWLAYQRKVKLIRADPLFADVNIIEHKEWLHQAHGLKRAMMSHMNPTCPIVFSIQDDTVCFGHMNVGLIVAALLGRLQGPKVEYVKLYWRRDLVLEKSDLRSVSPSHYSYETQPAIPHPATELLHETHFWSDRPHFALRSHYESRVWPRIAVEDRVTMEQACEQASSEDKNWGLWIYGPRGDMRRESHSKYARGNVDGSLSSYFVRTRTPVVVE
jgi:hypothetical protein